MSIPVAVCKNGHLQNYSNASLSKCGRYWKCNVCARNYIYAKRKAEGQPTKVKNMEDRFWLKVKKIEGGCWEWTGALNNQGYAMFSEKYGGHILGHRYSFKLHKGNIAEGYEIDHLCFNTKCVNPDHLESVTPSENVQRSYNRRKLKP